ncbi:MAG: transketolase [Deltaproteobacteria bacterium]|nr:transketolase [Deltaproteobacteria bacterium]
MTTPTTDQLRQMANKLRAHVLRMTTTAGSGHPTTCLSAAEIMSILFFQHLRFDPARPEANDVDHFILSKGHAAPILWAALFEAGALSDDLLTLRKLTSRLEGHPTPNHPWVRIATGSLGQGLSAGCGMAIGKQRADEPGEVFVLLGDGECAEGAVWEAAQFAGHYRLANLCAIVDLNRLAQSGPSYFGHDAEGLARRFAAFGWHTITVDGHDITALQHALAEARTRGDVPTAIIARTFKGQGLAGIADQDNWHGKPLPVDRLEAAIQALGPIDGRLIVAPQRLGGPATPARCIGTLDTPRYERGQLVATREAYGTALAKLAQAYPRLIALDADTKNSTFAEKMLQTDARRFVECFIAEQNMVGAALGLAATGWTPCVSTFACFLSRAYDFLRMAVISRPAHLILCGSHAGVSIGEDGPSQMAIEDIAMMRALVASTVVCPADAVATEHLLAGLLERPGVCYLRTARPKTPVLYAPDEAFPIGGAKILRQTPKDRCTIVAVGVTVHEALKAADQLGAAGIAVRVIDAYSIKPIDALTLRAAAVATGRVLSVEDHTIWGGLGDAVAEALSDGDHAGLVRLKRLGVHAIPRSGTPAELMAAHGIDANAIVQAVRTLIA